MGSLDRTDYSFQWRIIISRCRLNVSCSGGEARGGEGGSGPKCPNPARSWIFQQRSNCWGAAVLCGEFGPSDGAERSSLSLDKRVSKGPHSWPVTHSTSVWERDVILRGPTSHRARTHIVWVMSKPIMFMWPQSSNYAWSPFNKRRDLRKNDALGKKKKKKKTQRCKYCTSRALFYNYHHYY